MDERLGVALWFVSIVTTVLIGLVVNRAPLEQWSIKRKAALVAAFSCSVVAAMLSTSWLVVSIN